MEENQRKTITDDSSQIAILYPIVKKMTSDMNFVGIFTIIMGAISCLSIVGAIVGVPYIIAGIRIKDAADKFRMYLSSNDYVTLKEAFEKQSSFFFIYKVIYIVSLVIIALYIIGIILFVSILGGSLLNGDIFN